MSAVPYMNTYVADFLADTEDLTNEEFGAYVRLIFFNWKKRRALVDDTKRIARLLRCTPGRWLKKLKPVLIEFFETDESGAPIGGKLVQKRVEAERAKALNKALKDDESGIKNREKNAKKQAQKTRESDDILELEPELSDSSLREERGAGAPRGSRLRDDFTVPDEWVGEGYATRKKHHLPEIDLDLEAVTFVNYWRSAAGQRGRKVDWHATWINWCINAKGGANGRAVNRATIDGNGADGEEAFRRAGLAQGLSDLMGPDAASAA